MNCGQVKPILSEYFSGALDNRQKSELEEHLRFCNTCLVDFNKMKLYFEKLENLSAVIPSPKFLFDELIRHLQNEPVPSAMATKSNEPMEAQRKRTMTAELSRVETVQRKRRAVPVKKTASNDRMFVYIAVLLIFLLALFYAFLKFYKK